MKQTVGFHEGRSGTRSRQATLQTHDLDLVAKALGISGGVSRRAGSILSDAATMHPCWPSDGPVLAAAALYVACREAKIPTTLREIANASGTDPREVGRCYTIILEKMHITRPGLNGRNYVRHLALRRPLSQETYRTSEEIIKRATDAGLGGRNPMTLAAAALYIACCSMGEQITQAEVADAAGVGEESVRECCKAIRSIGVRLAV